MHQWLHGPLLQDKVIENREEYYRKKYKKYKKKLKKECAKEN
jgi:hypothetical protein